MAEPVDPVRLCPRLNEAVLPASEVTINWTSSTSDTYVQPLCMPIYDLQTSTNDRDTITSPTANASCKSTTTILNAGSSAYSNSKTNNITTTILWPFIRD